ncbi:MAG: hypothetical protein COB36_00460 [Alphaproteobacteria bacterium]|nr:MAG: hypothetical protein COB36_00460 [Alphaproteobacteria bacterium]
MNAAVDNRQNEFISGNMGKPALISIVFHVVVFALATMGLPYLVEEPEPMEMAITVELVDLSDISQTNLLDDPQENKEDEAPTERKPIYNNTDSVPDLLSPREPDVEDIPEPPKEKPKLDPTLIKKPPKPKNKPRKPKPAPPKQVEEQPKQDDQRDFTSLLKSLTPDEPDLKPAPRPVEAQSNQGQTSQVADFLKQMTRSELDDLNRGVQPCWSVNAGGKNAESLLVSLRVFVNPDLRVREVQIIDQLRYNADTHFRAAAEAAQRALLNPRCSTLRLPPEKYEQWKVFKYTFDPSQML